jgi:hypothetical protein
VPLPHTAPGSVVVVVVDPPGHTHPAWHASIAPLGDEGSGQLSEPSGSQSSPASTMPFPQTAPGTVMVVVVVVVVVGAPVVVVVGAPVVVVVVEPSGQTQPGWQASIAPLGDDGSGHVSEPTGSHSSPGSTMPLPQTGAVVVVVVVTVVVVVGAAVVVVVVDVMVVVVVASQSPG